MTTQTKPTYTPSDDQIQACQMLDAWREQITNSKRNRYDEFAIVQGGAGVGKTTVISKWIKDTGYEQENIITLAVSAIASRNAMTKVNASASYTVAQLIKQPVTELDCRLPTQNVEECDDPNINVVSRFSHPKRLLQYLERVVDAEIFNKEGQEEVNKVRTYIEETYANAIQDRTDELIILAKSKKSQQSATAEEIQLSAHNQAVMEISTTLDTLDIQELNKITPVLKFKHKTEFLTRDDALAKKPSIFDDVEIIFFDEVSMCDEADMILIRKLAKRFNILVVCAGDWAQIKPVNGEPNTFIAMTPESNYDWFTRLTTTHRQSPSSFLFHFVQNLRNGLNLRDAYNEIHQQAQNEKTTIGDVFVGNINRLAENVSNHVLTSADCVLTYKNKDVAMLTERIRRTLFPEKCHEFGFETAIQLGEKIMITTNEPSMRAEKSKIIINNATRLVNGMTGTVVAIRPVTQFYDDVSTYLSRKKRKTLLARWHKTYEGLKDSGLVQVTVIFEDLTKPQTFWLNRFEFNNPRVSESTLKNLSEARTFVHDYTAFQDFLQDKNSPLYCTLHETIVYATYGYVLTAHRAQGREWNNVVYYEDMNSRVHPNAHDTLRDVRYSAPTRAKKMLYVMHNLR